MLGSLEIIHQYMAALYMKVDSCLDAGILNKKVLCMDEYVSEWKIGRWLKELDRSISE